MKKYAILIMMALMFAFAVNGFSQKDNFSVGPRVGVNFANVSNVPGSEANTGIVLGLTSTYSINEFSGISMDVLYSQEGYELMDNMEMELNYLQIPRHYNVFFGQLGEKFRPKVYAGIAPGFLLSAEANETDVAPSYKNTVFSFSGGLGFNYRIANRIWLNTDLRSQIGLTDIREEAFQTNDIIAPRNFQLSVGVAFGLSRLD